MKIFGKVINVFNDGLHNHMLLTVVANNINDCNANKYLTITFAESHLYNQLRDNRVNGYINKNVKILASTLECGEIEGNQINEVEDGE